MKVEELADQITAWIATMVEGNDRDGAVFGLSGGIDSAVVGALCQRALGSKALGVIMPCQSNAEDADYAEMVAAALQIETALVPLDSVYEELLRVLPAAGQGVRVNVKPRLRMMTLYYLAAARSGLVVGTGNLSEWYVGYFTKHGDGAADIYPLAGLVKTYVAHLAAYMGVPVAVRERAPSAGLWAGQRDEAEMGLRYAELDRLILSRTYGERYNYTPSPQLLERVEELVRSSEHKRQPGPVFHLDEPLEECE